jgi:hypothetical protein
MGELPVREMVLYKHGVGFFVREGVVAGENAALTFRQDEINDVLKSLAVFDQSGGQVLGIHYQTPMDREDRLANSSIRLSTQASLVDLLRDLRGRRASLAFETTPGTTEAVTGRVIGIDHLNQQQKNLGMLQNSDSLVTILADDGQVRAFRLDMLRSFQIHDTQSSHDLSYFLDTSMSEDTRRIVNVRLSEGDHQLVVYYVAPSPTWRVSYRLVAETDKDAETGKALLQGWGLFDNRLEEDLEDVKVTLVAGQPISFIYELYASRIPHRPTVQDESRVAPGPIEFAGAQFEVNDMLLDEAEEFAPEKRKGILAKRLGGAPAMSASYMSAPAPAMTRESMISSAPPAATAKEAGEFFQYAVTVPVTVKRGESALVPIIGSEINYSRELLYNGAKLPTHPVAALRFNNSTGLTLERGPVTVVENGDYKGEAVVAFTKDGNQVYLPYAVELGVRVTENYQNKTQTTGLSIKDAYLIYQEYVISEATYTLENTAAKLLTVTIEASIINGYELFDTRATDVTTATERRWRVDVPARGKAEFVRKERRLTRRHEDLRNLNHKNLQYFMDNRWLDQTTFKRLSEMLDTMQKVRDASVRKELLNTESGNLYKQQEQLRANLGVLQPTGQEATLRNRILGQLEATQNRLEEINRQLEEEDKKITQGNEKVQQIINGLSQS